MNILYLDDYINYYSYKLNKIIIIKPYKDTLRNGYIINRFKFMRVFNKLLSNYHIKPSILNEKITIVLNNYATIEDKLLFKEIFNELNYKEIVFKNESNYFKIKKDILYINCNYNYFYLLSINYVGDLTIDLYQNNEINKKCIKEIIKYKRIKTIILYGKNIQEIKIYLENENIKYYYFEDSDNLILKNILNDKFM